MSDPRDDGYSPTPPYITKEITDEYGIKRNEKVEIEELKEQFQVELISWTFSEPLQNTYK